MRTEKITASNTDSKGKALTDLNGVTLTEDLEIPETMDEIDQIWGSLEKCVEDALATRRIKLQTKVRARYDSLQNGTGKNGSTKVGKIAR